jgi:hypothetical protein
MYIHIVEEIKHPDGTVTWQFDVDEEFKKAVKVRYGLNRYSKKAGQRFIIDVLHNRMRNDLLKELDEVKKEAYLLNKIKDPNEKRITK